MRDRNKEKNKEKDKEIEINKKIEEEREVDKNNKKFILPNLRILKFLLILIQINNKDMDLLSKRNKPLVIGFLMGFKR